MVLIAQGTRRNKGQAQILKESSKTDYGAYAGALKKIKPGFPIEKHALIFEILWHSASRIPNRLVVCEC